MSLKRGVSVCLRGAHIFYSFYHKELLKAVIYHFLLENKLDGNVRFRKVG